MNNRQAELKYCRKKPRSDALLMKCGLSYVDILRKFKGDRQFVDRDATISRKRGI